MGYIIYHKIAAKRAIKGLERVQAQSEIKQETKRYRALRTVWARAQHWMHIKSAERHYTIGKRNIASLGYMG
jgi:hypothetical protein